MKSHNIANMPANKRAEVELSKHAALLIWQLKYGKISRNDVQMAIDKVDESQLEMFREMINKFRK